MADHTQVRDAFDARLERALTGWGETAVRPVDAIAIAERAIALQRRQSLRRTWTWLAVAAALTLLALFVAAALGGGGRTIFDGLSLGPVPSATAPATASVGSPVGLQGRWMGAPRAIGDLAPSAGTYLAIDDQRLCVSGRDYAQTCTVLLSSATVLPPDHLQLVSRPGGRGCAVDDAGLYAWQLSGGKNRLTISSPGDSCAARQAGVLGTWYRSDCRNAADDCLGLLENGRYPSQFLHPKGPSEAPASDYGAISYAVPSGWANSGDWPVLLSLTPAADYTNETEAGAAIGAYHELDLLAHPLPAAANATCDGSVDGSLRNPTPEQFVAWLKQQPQFLVADRPSVTVSGLPGVVVDIKLGPGHVGICAGETERSADYLVLRDDPGRGFTPRLRGAETHRLILVQMETGELLAILIDSSDPGRFGELVNAAMPIVDSLVIR